MSVMYACRKWNVKSEDRALRKNLCKNNQPQKNDFVVRAADRSLYFLFQYKLNTAVCQAPDAKYPDFTALRCIRIFCGASVQPVRIHYLKLTEHFAPIPKRHCPFFWISPLLPDTKPLKVLYRSEIRSADVFRRRGLIFEDGGWFDGYDK